MSKTTSENTEKMTMPVSDELSSLLRFLKEDLSKELPTLTIDTDYFILGVFGSKDNDLYRRLDGCLMSSAMENIYNSFYQLVSSKALSAVKSNRKVTLDKGLSDALKRAEDEAKSMGSEEVTTEHVFLAILADNNENNKIRKLFNRAGLTYGIMKGKISDGEGEEEKVNPFGGKIKVLNFSSRKEAEKFIKELNQNVNDSEGVDLSDPMFNGTPKKKKGKNPNIKAYCTDLNELAEQGKIEPLVGRDREISEIIRILGRRKKNNAILLGGEGVGKTAIGEALALKIINGDVPDFLLGRRLVSLDMTALMAGTTLRGMFEERVKGILDEIKADPSFILFMDNIGAILADKSRNDYEISSMLARSLENGEIQVIGTSDFASYRKTFDKDPSLARRFQKILVEAPSIQDSLEILNGIKKSYESFHKVRYDDDAIEACVNLANRYITERNLPDSAIDIMDEAGALVGTIQEKEELKNLRVLISSKENEYNEKKADENFAEADKINDEITNLKQEYNDAKAKYDKEREENPSVVTKDIILNIISIKTNIPVNNLTSDDKKNLVHMNDRMKEEVIGQDEAIDTICKALKRNRIGLHKNGCMYSCMAIGKTGVGKCVSGNTIIRVKNKKTNKLEELTIKEFKNLFA